MKPMDLYLPKCTSTPPPPKKKKKKKIWPAQALDRPIDPDALLKSICIYVCLRFEIFLANPMAQWLWSGRNLMQTKTRLSRPHRQAGFPLVLLLTLPDRLCVSKACHVLRQQQSKAPPRVRPDNINHLNH